MGAFRAAGYPLENLHNRAVFGLTSDDGAVGCQSLGTQQRDVFAGELQQVSFFAGLGLVRNDDDGAARSACIETSSLSRGEPIRFGGANAERRAPNGLAD